MIFKANFYVADTDALLGLLDAMKAIITKPSSGSHLEQYPFYSGEWSLVQSSAEQRYTPDELDDLSTIPFGR